MIYWQKVPLAGWSQEAPMSHHVIGLTWEVYWVVGVGCRVSHCVRVEGKESVKRKPLLSIKSYSSCALGEFRTPGSVNRVTSWLLLTCPAVIARFLKADKCKPLNANNTQNQRRIQITALQNPQTVIIRSDTFVLQLPLWILSSKLVFPGIWPY